MSQCHSSPDWLISLLVPYCLKIGDLFFAHMTDVLILLYIYLIVFLYVHLFSAIERVSHGKAL